MKEGSMENLNVSFVISLIQVEVFEDITVASVTSLIPIGMLWSIISKSTRTLSIPVVFADFNLLPKET